MKNSFDPTKYISSGKAFKEIIELTGNISSDKFLKAPEYKDDREKWIACIYAICIKKMIKKNVWLQQLPQGQDPPDFKVISKKNNSKFVDEASIEIVEVPPRTNFNKIKINRGIIKTIDKKIEASLTGRWPKYYQLCVYCNFTGKVDIKKLQKILKGKNPPFGQIWLVGANNINLTRIFLIEIWPNNQQITIGI